MITKLKFPAKTQTEIYFTYEEYFFSLAEKYDAVVFVEDGIVTGGISEYIASVYGKRGFSNFAIKAFPEKYYSQGSRNDVLVQAGLTPEDLKSAALKILENFSK